MWKLVRPLFAVGSGAGAVATAESNPIMSLLTGMISFIFSILTILDILDLIVSIFI